MFSAIGDLVASLRKPLAGGGEAAKAKLQNALSTANVKVTNAHDNVLTVRSSVGSRMNEIDALKASGLARADRQDLPLGAGRPERGVRSPSSSSARPPEGREMTFSRLHSISLFNYL